MGLVRGGSHVQGADILVHRIQKRMSTRPKAYLPPQQNRASHACLAGSSVVEQCKHSTQALWQSSASIACKHSTQALWQSSASTACKHSTQALWQSSASTACKHSTQALWQSSASTACKHSVHGVELRQHIAQPASVWPLFWPARPPRDDHTKRGRSLIASQTSAQASPQQCP